MEASGSSWEDGASSSGDRVDSSWRRPPAFAAIEKDRLGNKISLSAGDDEVAAASSRAATKMSRRQRWILASLSAGGLLAGCCIAVMIPFFPHEAQRRELPQTYSGAVFSCYALSQLLAFPVMGRLAPLVGVKRLYNLGLAVTGVATVVFGVLSYITDSTAFIGACLACRILEAVGTAALHTASRAIIINQFPSNPNTAMSIAETLVGVGLSLGPALGGGLYQVGGYGAPFYTLGCAMLVTAVVNRWTMPDVADTAS